MMGAAPRARAHFLCALGAPTGIEAKAPRARVSRAGRQRRCGAVGKPTQTPPRKGGLTIMAAKKKAAKKGGKKK